MPKGVAALLAHAIGQSAYKGRKGVEPLGAKGIYLLQEPRRIGTRRLQIVNLLERGRLKAVADMGEHVGLVEDDLIYPLISGRNIDKWGLNSTTYIVMPHENKAGVQNEIPESTMRVNYQLTYEWLSYFKDVLRETRERNSKFYLPTRPFYFLDNIGAYTFAPYKVAWKEQGQPSACVISTIATEPLQGKMIVPDSKVLFCAVDLQGRFITKEEAHYLCAILNSTPIVGLIKGYSIDLQKGADILENVRIPAFDPEKKLHLALSQLSDRAHEAYINDKTKLPILQKRIDMIVMKVFA